MAESFLISKAKRYDVKGKHYIDTPFKVYFEDIGLRNARLNFRQIEPSHIMENIIYNELRIRGYHVDVGVGDQHLLGEQVEPDPLYFLDVPDAAVGDDADAAQGEKL